MADSSLTCMVQLESEHTAPGGGVMVAVRRGKAEVDENWTAPDRLQRAAAWALDLDAQYRDLAEAGQRPRIEVSVGRRAPAGRVHRQTAAEYRRLRLGVGALIKPLLLDPPELQDLYPFQRRGVDWLKARTGAVLADDMGLGKTVQVISATRLLFNRGKIRTSLVICPKSLIANWEREFSRWAPELGIAVVTPPAGTREEAWRLVTGYRHVLLTNYEQLREVPEALRRAPPDLVIADEAHRLRNRGAQITSGSYELRPKHFWALTGTPIERDQEDLATLLSLVVPSRFAPDDAKLPADSLRSRARRYILRRRKEQVLDDLPPVLDTTEALELTREQQTAYRAAVKRYRRVSEDGNELALLTRLHALCDIEADSGASSKVERILFLLGRIRARDEKAVVFSHRLQPLRELRYRLSRRFGDGTSAFLVGEMDDRERERAVSAFRANERIFVLLASSQIGGEGFTFTEANHVFLFNQWWNPSANDQARDRVVRIGQRRKVRVYRFCCRGTIEEALERILAAKQKLFEDVVERLAQGDQKAWHKVVRDVGMGKLLPPE